MQNKLNSIIQVTEAYYSKTVNCYLDLGWVLLSTNIIPSADTHIGGPCYILGWDKNNGDIKHPDTSNDFDRLRDKHEAATAAFLNGNF